ncbi:DUF2917 domain-containing protein [Noviherbaspirillum cavernae]|uniref:DUF2917 domain-containing protein n=1 Tax=Noviherbaspirillum cavernae TaxID=2320862 RepID=A0A418WX90_9BURK|nr:DUF2917 domain-containing protein [Noviherbaspirillum cavernae]RJG04859.1 DUF2917 domain-containing protein [Noviherbaspirillum cavernae]
MRDLFTNKALVIPAGQASSGIAKQGQTLRIVRGRAWVTMEGVSHDYWLSAGNALQTIPGQLTVVEADPAKGNLEVRIERPQSPGAKLATQLAGLVQRFAYRKNAQATLQRPALAQCK